MCATAQCLANVVPQRADIGALAAGHANGDVAPCDAQAQTPEPTLLPHSEHHEAGGPINSTLTPPAGLPDVHDESMTELRAHLATARAGLASKSDDGRRDGMQAAGRELVDGRGDDRITALVGGHPAPARIGQGVGGGAHARNLVITNKVVNPHGEVRAVVIATKAIQHLSPVND